MTRRRRSDPGPNRGSHTAEPRFRLREPVDVLAAIPFLIGYHPVNSLVMLGMQGKDLVFTARFDLLPVTAGRQVIRDAINHMLQVLVRQRLTSVVIVGFGPDDRVRPLATTLQRAYARAGLDVLEVLRAENGRYWSYLCTDPTCCPESGTEYDVAASAVAAEWTVAGRVALPDREAYEEQLRPVTGPEREAMRVATAKADDRLIELLAQPGGEAEISAALVTAGHTAIDRALRQIRKGTTLSDEDTAWLSVLMGAVDPHDIAWTRLRGARADLTAHRTLWMDVMRRADADLTPAPGCLFAFAAWQCGEGALANLALERVLRMEPNYPMAHLLHHILLHGLPPSALDHLPRRRIRQRPAQGKSKRSSSRRAESRRA